ncbi:odorant receptor 49b-like isoform X3 [Rhynchophorus ferrugineus]|uniref:odorant receptor 49b-like isoform X3 n=1 Tax=Rhynchophorus ferrugineus TaxID=354439 RepID=UPI003FCE06F1
MKFPDNKLLKISMYLFTMVGVWPIIHWDSLKSKRIYEIGSAILYYYYLEYIFRAYFKLYLLLTTDTLYIEEILGNLCITLIYTVSLFRLKAFNTEAIRTLFTNIIDEEKLILNNSDPEIRRMYMSSVKDTVNYNILFLFNGWVVSFLYFIHPFFMELPTQIVNNETVTLRTLPLSTWWPIDIQEHYWLAYCWNVFDGTLGSSYVINSDILTFSLIVFALSQVKILGYKLRQFPTYRETGNKEEDNKNIQLEFVTLVKEHKKVISYIDTFNEGMKYVMLFDFLQCSVQLATITLQLLVMEINVQNVIFVGEFLLTMLIRLVIYYFNANEVMYQSQHLALDIWNSRWYEQNEKLKRMMLIFIVRSQKPLRFLIGPFGVMSLETFISVT